MFGPAQDGRAVVKPSNDPEDEPVTSPGLNHGFLGRLTGNIRSDDDRHPASVSHGLLDLRNENYGRRVLDTVRNLRQIFGNGSGDDGGLRRTFATFGDKHDNEQVTEELEELFHDYILG